VPKRRSTVDDGLKWLTFLTNHPELLPGPVACAHPVDKQVRYSDGVYCGVCGTKLRP
jgi:hypothetical protein